MPRPLAYLAAKLGRRGGVLFVLGLVFLIIGLKSILAPAEDDGRFILYTFLPVPIRGALWIIPATLAIFSSFRRGSGRDGLGFMALVIPATVVAFSYVWSFVGYLFGATDWPLGWSSAAIWISILLLVLLVSGWREPDPIPERRPE